MFEQQIERAKNLILSPAEEWQAIDGESVDIATLYKTWIIPLAALPAIAGFIGSSIFGIGAFGFHIRVPFFPGLFHALIQFVLTLAEVFVFAHVISFLAPYFGAQKNLNQALKLAAYMPVAAWLSGVFLAFPALSILAFIGGIYSLYLLFVGLPVLMNPPEDKAVLYTASSIITAVILSFILVQITQAMVPHRMPGASLQGTREPGLDKQVSALEAASQTGDLGGMLAALGGGSGKVITDLDALKKLAPMKLASLKRTDISVEKSDTPIEAVTLKAIYQGNSSRQITLSVMQSPGVNFLKAMAGMSGLSRSTKKPDGSFESLKRENNTLVMQNWNAQTAKGTYAWSYKNFIVSVEGKDIPFKALKKASTVISTKDLERLMKG